MKRKTSQAFVSKSIDPNWTKFAAVIPGRQTEWFDTEAEARAAIEPTPCPTCEDEECAIHPTSCRPSYAQMCAAQLKGQP